MNKWSLFTGIVMFSILLSSCGGDRFELKEDKHGRTVRLDKRTGEVVLIEDDQMIAIKTPAQLEKERELERKKYESHSKPISRDTLNIPQAQIDSAFLTTKWVENELIYRLTIMPIPEQYTQYNGISDPYIINFIDSTGFEITQRNVSKSDFHRLTDSTGVASAIQTEGKIECSAREYMSIFKWSLSWRTRK
jgi:hypothetical protein